MKITIEIPDETPQILARLYGGPAPTPDSLKYWLEGWIAFRLSRMGGPELAVSMLDAVIAEKPRQPWWARWRR